MARKYRILKFFGFNPKNQLIKTAVFLLLAFAIAFIFWLICR